MQDLVILEQPKAQDAPLCFIPIVKVRGVNIEIDIAKTQRLMGVDAVNDPSLLSCEACRALNSTISEESSRPSLLSIVTRCRSGTAFCQAA